MKKTALFLMALTGLVLLSSCNDEETYADQKEREAKNINNWIASHDIDVISMEDFLKDTVTNNPETGPDFSKNEYVLFSDNGVYMQIVRRGEGQAMKPGDNWDMNARFVEVYIETGDTINGNIFVIDPDKFTMKRTGDNYTASFTTGKMSDTYGTSVPNSWIMAMPFIRPGFLNGKSAAKIRIISPHNQGTQQAASSVYPAFYEIIISKQKWQ